MAPLQSRSSSRSLRHGSPRASPSGSPSASRLPPERSASFHGRTSDQLKRQQNVMPRPKTQPDLLATTASAGRRMIITHDASCSGGEQRKVPAKVLVNVNVQRSLGAVQVMASTDWSVDQLVAAAIKQYVKEGRRPLLPASSDPAHFGLHYSQFSLDCLDPKEKLIGLGSRNFFLCPKVLHKESSAAADTLPPASSSCSGEAREASKRPIPWLRFMDFLL